MATIPAAAQKASEWDAFRFTDSDREVAAGLREVQQLLQGRESLVQSYENTDQSQIETERAIEKLYQDRIQTKKAALSYAEAWVNFKFPESEDTLEPATHADLTEDEAIARWLSQIEENLKSYSPPQPIPSLFLPLKLLPIDIDLYGAAMIGTISHALIDLANLEGVALTYPLLKHHRWVFPGDAAYRVKADSPREQVLRMVGLLVMTGLLALNLLGGRTVFHSFLGTPSAIGRDYADQLKQGHRLVVTIEGIWTRGQGHVDDEFDVVASTDVGIFVRRPSDPMKLYEISSGPFSAISHARLSIVRRIRAEHRLVTITFDGEGWKTDLVSQYPYALVSGSLLTRAHPPAFGIDEFHTIQRFGDRWELTHAPIELVSQRLGESGAKISGEIQIRYWKEKAADANHRGES